MRGVQAEWRSTATVSHGFHGSSLYGSTFYGSRFERRCGSSIAVEGSDLAILGQRRSALLGTPVRRLGTPGSEEKKAD
jgi:hypothetical protein